MNCGCSTSTDAELITISTDAELWLQYVDWCWTHQRIDIQRIIITRPEIDLIPPPPTHHIIMAELLDLSPAKRCKPADTSAPTSTGSGRWSQVGQVGVLTHVSYGAFPRQCRGGYMDSQLSAMQLCGTREVAWVYHTFFHVIGFEWLGCAQFYAALCRAQ